MVLNLSLKLAWTLTMRFQSCEGHIRSIRGLSKGTESIFFMRKRSSNPTARETRFWRGSFCGMFVSPGDWAPSGLWQQLLGPDG